MAKTKITKVIPIFIKNAATKLTFIVKATKGTVKSKKPSSNNDACKTLTPMPRLTRSPVKTLSNIKLKTKFQLTAARDITKLTLTLVSMALFDTKFRKIIVIKMAKISKIKECKTRSFNNINIPYNIN